MYYSSTGTSSLAFCTTLPWCLMVEGQEAWYILTSTSYLSKLQQGCQREDKELLPNSQFCYVPG